MSIVEDILFGIHSEDLCDELRDLVSELNKSKVALWKQMCIIEIIAADLADHLTQGGTKFEMEPDRVIWPDGTITKKSTPSGCSKRTKKVPPAVSKDGLYGVIIAQYANVKKTTATYAGASTSATKPPELSVIIEIPENDAPSASAAPKPKQVRRVNYILYLNKEHKRFKTFCKFAIKIKYLSIFTLYSMES